MEFENEHVVHTKATCNAAVTAVRDALYVLSGKWKLPVIMALSTTGPMRFNEIQRSLEDISPKILSKELRELELNEFVERKVFPTVPVSVTYQLTPYSKSLEKIVGELYNWGVEHRERIVASRRRPVASPAP